jgi:hypothetical protein
LDRHKGTSALPESSNKAAANSVLRRLLKEAALAVFSSAIEAKVRDKNSSALDANPNNAAAPVHEQDVWFEPAQLVNRGLHLFSRLSDNLKLNWASLGFSNNAAARDFVVEHVCWANQLGAIDSSKCEMHTRFY